MDENPYQAPQEKPSGRLGGLPMSAWFWVAVLVFPFFIVVGTYLWVTLRAIPTQP